MDALAMQACARPCSFPHFPHVCTYGPGDGQHRRPEGVTTPLRETRNRDTQFSGYMSDDVPVGLWHLHRKTVSAACRISNHRNAAKAGQLGEC